MNNENKIKCMSEMVEHLHMLHIYHQYIAGEMTMYSQRG